MGNTSVLPAEIRQLPGDAALKHNREVKMGLQNDGKNKDNDGKLGKMISINGESMKALIRVKKGLAWKCLNKVNNGCMDDGIIRYVHGIEAIIESV
ncbi:12305_t:CDS:2, partial [Gigaspora margarita]